MLKLLNKSIKYITIYNFVTVFNEQQRVKQYLTKWWPNSSINEEIQM